MDLQISLRSFSTQRYSKYNAWAEKLPAVAAGENILRLIQDGGADDTNMRNSPPKWKRRSPRETSASNSSKGRKRRGGKERTWRLKWRFWSEPHKRLFSQAGTRFTRFSRPLVATSHSYRKGRLPEYLERSKMSSIEDTLCPLPNNSLLTTWDCESLESKLIKGALSSENAPPRREKPWPVEIETGLSTSRVDSSVQSLASCLVYALL